MALHVGTIVMLDLLILLDEAICQGTSIEFSSDKGFIILRWLIVSLLRSSFIQLKLTIFCSDWLIHTLDSFYFPYNLRGDTGVVLV